MSVPVLLAVTDARWESDLVGAVAGGSHPIEVARRCVDVADLLAAAAAGAGRAAIVSADLRRLDRDTLTRLAVCGLAVVGLADPADEAAERRLRQLGVAQVLTIDATPAAAAAAVLSALAQPLAPAERDWGEPRRALADRPRAPGGDPAADGSAAVDSGGDAAAAGTEGAEELPRPVIAVWGPPGAPGRSTVAVNLAAELARLAGSALLVDADVYAASVAQLLGLLDESPGIAAACRLANAGRLDVLSLADVALAIRGGLRVLTGIPRADRWPELRPSAVSAVLATGRRLAPVTVADVSFCLEQDEELSFDTAAPRRNGATLSVLDAAEVVLAVTAADPVGLQRFVRSVAALREAVPTAVIVPVVNRLRRGCVPGGDPRTQIAAALDRYAGLGRPWFLPDDPVAADAAVTSGRVLGEAAPDSPLRAAVARVAQDLATAHIGLAPARPPGPVRRRWRGHRAPRYAGR